MSAEKYAFLGLFLYHYTEKEGVGNIIVGKKNRCWEKTRKEENGG